MSRIPMQPGDRITLTALPEGIDPVHFLILGNISRGHSAFCYEALLNTRRGWLKEFYPADFSCRGERQYLALTRDSTNRLTAPGEAMAVRFREMCRGYAKGYAILDRNAQPHILPNHHLFHGGSVYVWMPEAESGQTFGTWLSAIHENPGNYTLEHLARLFSILKTLSDALRSLHAAGLLHLDIRPDTVLLLPGNKAVQLRDTDGIHTIQTEFPSIAGSEGFRAPEVLLGRAENRSDIYSVGRLLLYAIAPDQQYRDEDFPRISQYVSWSSFLRALKPRSHAYLRCITERILRRSLAPRPELRYSCCEALMEDLDQVISCCTE